MAVRGAPAISVASLIIQLKINACSPFPTGLQSFCLKFQKAQPSTHSGFDFRPGRAGLTVVS